MSHAVDAKPGYEVQLAGWTTIVGATAVGVLIAGIYVLSPMTVWFGLAMWALIARAPVGLSDRERRWVVGVLTTAVLLRAIALALLFVYFTHPAWSSREPLVIGDGDRSFWSLFGDEVYNKLRTLWMRDAWLGVRLGPSNVTWAFDRLYGWSGYNYLVAYLQVRVGPTPFGIHLLNAGMYMLGAVLLWRFARRAVGAVAALGGLILLLFLPTLFIWSISALKEPCYFLVCVLAVVGTGRSVSAQGWIRRLAWGMTAVAALAMMSTLRPELLPIAAAALVVALIVHAVAGNRRLVSVLALVAIVAMTIAASRPALRQQGMSLVRYSAHRHLAHVLTPGVGYRVLGDRFYASGLQETIDTMTWPEAASYLVWSVVSFISVPFPWRAGTRSALAIVPQQIVWYLMVAALPWGIVAAVRRDRAVAIVLVAYVVLSSAAIALTNGNVGTLVRYRDSVIPFMVWLSALGGLSWLQFATSRPLHAEDHAARR